jgi:hypothetical protein
MSGVAISLLRPPPSPEAIVLNGSSRPAAGWPEMDSAALQGLSGEVIRVIGPQTEADPAALLASFLAAFGSAVGNKAGARADGAPHPARLFVVIAGDTAKARKGTSWQRIREVMQAADREWLKGVVTGLSSGEGLVKAASSRGDKRILVHEAEFARVLGVAGREGNTLSAVLREAWDGGPLRVMTREPLEAEGAHISVVAHITIEELQATMSSIQAANGFGNRFLFVCARRPQLLPSGGNLDDQEVAELGRKVRARIEEARKTPILRRTPEAEAKWDHLYRELALDTPGGVLGALVARAEAQLLRLSVAYALCDGSSRIEPRHLDAAHGFWRYCRDSTAHIFGDRMGNPEGELILSTLRSAGGCLNKTDLSRLLGKHLYGTRLDRALDFLEAHGKVQVDTVRGTGGRPKTLIVAADA